MDAFGQALLAPRVGPALVDSPQAAVLRAPDAARPRPRRFPGDAQQVKGEQQVPVWPSVREELRALLALLPRLDAPLETPWCDEVKTVDASLRGYGVLEASCLPGRCAEVGRWKERSRFRGANATAENPRERALGRAVTAMQHAEARALAIEVGFPEVPAADIFQSAWHVVTSRRWTRRSRRILELEGSSLVWCVRHLARSMRAHGHRHLLLPDNLALVCALAKGRATLFATNAVCRTVGAHALAMGARLITRWIPSEVNPADLPSREDLEFDEEVVAAWTQVGRTAQAPDEQGPPGLASLPPVAWRRRPLRGQSLRHAWV